MSGVNFLDNAKKEDEESNINSDDAKKGDIKWSEVDQKKVDKKEEDKKEEGNKVEKKTNNTASSDDISSWLKSLKEDKGVEGKGAKELKKSKEALGEYQKVLRQTKKAAAMKEGVDKIKETGEVKVKPEGGIADIIKSKLSFGGVKEDVTVKTNLIKSEGVTYFDWKEKIKVVIINVLLTLVILGTGYGYLEYRERGIDQKSSGLQEEIDRLNLEIKSLEEEIEVVDEFQRKVKIANDLLSKHIYWTNFFKFLEDNLLSDVYLESSFSGRTDGVFSLKAIGKNFTNLTDQMRVIRDKEEIISVNIDSGEITKTTGEGAQDVEFNLEMVVDPAIFYK